MKLGLWRPSENGIRHQGTLVPNQVLNNQGIILFNIKSYLILNIN